MKNIKYILKAIVIVFFITSCEEDTKSEVLENLDTAGVILKTSGSASSSILGLPEPGVNLDEAEITITNANLDLTVNLISGSLNGISKIEIVKSFNGGQEISLAETTTLPYNLNVNNLDDLLAGTGVIESDLRIGDVLSFRTKIHQTDGDVYYLNKDNGNYDIVINCSSDLAGNYTNPDSPDCAQANPITITEVAPGRYYISSMAQYSWQSGNCIGYYVIDVCGQLTYDGGDLEDNGYTGGGTGQVNADGSITIVNILEEAGFEGTTTYTPL